MKKSVFVLSILFLASAFSFASGSADAASSKAAATDAATDVKIDFRMNIAKQDYESNYFNWTLGKQETVQDKFDAVSGASLKGSTKEFNVVRYAGNAADKKAAIPAALRSLFLFPLSDWKFVEEYGLQVTNTDGALTIRFARKATAYELKTDNKGNFNILTGAKIAKDITDKTETGYMIKPEYLKEGGDPAKMSDLDWNKVPLKDDTFASDAAYHYEGTLKFALKDNVLTVNGTLNRK
ncbi:hypothetical protein E4N71_10485 [Treponema vincentii]|jgi:hypothetical protein|uniref:Uncharacterized protein n=1 Tax=Treponema vincentii ATCC 35580 TaxID=596324 RepID=C8PN90_9SPIR|nr:hypothetical protein [Treponema vincentii]EEV21233.1 hypothetical protein TREVI0001_1596 [Treponema vincentii ATCC 35580]UTC49238.1 hypothetical protein E4N73_10520 [Treponema vincentii]